MIAIAPLGSPVYVTSQTWGNVVEINTFDNHVQGTPTGVRTDPTSITISPDGTTSYVTNFSADTVTPITTATGTRGTAIPVGAYPRDVAVSPDGATAYVSDSRRTSSPRSTPPAGQPARRYSSEPPRWVSQ